MLDHYDHEMIALAKDRGKVRVTRGGRTALVTLIAWRPQRNGKHRNVARVQFGSGTYASIPLHQVQPMEE